MRTFKIIVVAVMSLIIAVLAGCGSGGWGEPVHKNVYVAGYYNDGSYDIAAVWKNDVRSDLTSTGYSARANSVFISGGHVYVAGYYKSGLHSIACIWTDGVKTDLLSSGIDSYANSVFVSGGSVYVAGSYGLDGSAYTATVWKDGVTLYDLPAPGTGWASSIFVSGGSVYVSGNYWDFNPSHRPPAAVWIDGVRTDLPSDNRDAAAPSIFVSDGHVYVGGFYWAGDNFYIGTVWTDGVKNDLTTGGNIAYLQSIYVDNGNVYVAGSYNDASGAVATVWENGTQTALPCMAGKTTTANSIFVMDGVYVAGNDYDEENASTVATVWEDGAILSSLPAPDVSNSSYANSIFVINER